jgi:hypothetical protein
MSQQDCLAAYDILGRWHPSVLTLLEQKTEVSAGRVCHPATHDPYAAFDWFFHSLSPYKYVSVFIDVPSPFEAKPRPRAKWPFV